LENTDAIEKQIYINSQHVKKAKGSFIWAKKGCHYAGKGIRKLIGNEVLGTIQDVPYLNLDGSSRNAVGRG
jgi:hypothetical protein